MVEHNVGSLGAWSSRVTSLLTYGPTVVAVLGSAVLALFAGAMDLTEMQTLQFILGLLSLIATSLLVERVVQTRSTERRLDEISGQLGSLGEYARQVRASGFDNLIIRRRDLAPLEDRLNGARRVAVYGGSLFRLLSEYQVLFEELAGRGCLLQFMIADPESEAAQHLNDFVVYEANTVQSYRAQAKVAVERAGDLIRRFPSRCEGKIIALSPPYSLMIVESEGASGAQVELYGYKIPARDRPVITLDSARDPKLFQLFCDQFGALWGSQFAKPIVASK